MYLIYLTSISDGYYGKQYFVGLSCSENWERINLKVYSDEFCAHEGPQEVFYNTNHAKPHNHNQRVPNTYQNQNPHPYQTTIPHPSYSNCTDHRNSHYRILYDSHHHRYYLYEPPTRTIHYLLDDTDPIERKCRDVRHTLTDRLIRVYDGRRQ